MSGFELRRRRDLPELFRDSLALYRLHVWVFLALAAAVVVPVDLIDEGVSRLAEAYRELAGAAA